MPTFDVTPKEYARRFNASRSLATRMFGQWHADGEPFVIRTGIRTTRFPEGKLLRMSREHYDRMEKK